MKRIATALLVLAAAAPPAAAGGGCIAAGTALTEEHASEVRIDGACWRPGVAVVPTGTTVTYTNPHDGMEHNLSGPGIGFAELPAGSTHRVTFGQAGYYPFQCTIHPGMAGVVVVRDLPAGAPEGPAERAVPAAPASGDGGGTSLPAWAVVAAAAAAIGSVAFARRARGVPVPAR